jgi:hypothetical protein
VNSSQNRGWAVAGPLAIVLWVVGLILLTHNAPPDHATGADILAWYRSETNTILFGGWAFMLGSLAFVTLVSGLRVRLTDAVGSSSMLPGLALAGAAITGVCGMLTAAVDVGGAIDKNDIEPSTAAAFHHLLEVFFVTAELAVILPLAAVAIVAWRTQILPRWWAVFSALVAVVLVIGPIGWAGLIFGVPIWTLGTSLFVLLRSPERMRAAAATA